MEQQVPVIDLTAGWAVGKGALHAGTLAKRSEWLKAFNPRFFILTVDEVCAAAASRTHKRHRSPF